MAKKRLVFSFTSTVTVHVEFQALLCLARQLHGARTTSSPMWQPAIRGTLNIWGYVRSLGTRLSFRVRKPAGTGADRMGDDSSQNVVAGRGPDIGLPLGLVADPASLSLELHELISGKTRLTYVINKPFVDALKQLRAALRASGFQIPTEINISAWINSQLGVTLRPCVALEVACPVLLLKAAIMDPTAAALVPIKVIVTEAGSRSLVRLVFRADAALIGALRAELNKFLEGVLGVLRELGPQKVVPEAVP